MNLTPSIAVDLFGLHAGLVPTRWLYRFFRYFFSKVSAHLVSDDSSDEILMTAYLDGDQGAFRKLFNRYAPRLYSAALRRGLSAADANDAVQQTFVHIHQSRRDFRQGATVRPWVYTIAFNVMRDYTRRMSTHHRLKERIAAEAKIAAHSERDQGPEASPDLQWALDRLSPAQREVLVLHFFEDMNFRDIAQMVGSREGAVRVRAHRAYEKLRSILSRKSQFGGASA